MFGCNNDRLVPEKYTVKDHISNTKLEKDPSLLEPRFSFIAPYRRDIFDGSDEASDSQGHPTRI